MSIKETKVGYEEHRAIVFELPRKEASKLARFLKDHAASSKIAFAVDTETLDMVVIPRENREEDFLEYHGVEDIMEVETTEIEEEEEILVEDDADIPAQEDTAPEQM